MAKPSVQTTPTHAPYTFVPLLNKIAVRYQTIEDLPRHDTWEPDLLSGIIGITVTAETPICVSNGRGREEGLNFYQTPDGSYAIPGSSLRGMVRTNMQILGLGKLRADADFTDSTFFYRDFSSAEDSKQEPAKKYYQNVLGITKESDKPEHVCAGYLHCESDSDTYFIRPCKGDTYFCVRRDIHDGLWNDLYTASVPIYYTGDQKVITPAEWKQLDEEQQVLWKSGTLLSPGRIAGHQTLYIFPEEDAARRIDISADMAVLYATDYKERKNSLRGTDKRHPMDPEFWALPKRGTYKPVFYIPDSNYFGMSQNLRIAYAHSLSHGLPELHRPNDFILDYPNAILGFAEKDMSYRSRVSFGDCKVVSDIQTSNEIQMILGGPKLSFFPNYTIDGKDYNQDDFQLRGIKQYWLKKPENPELETDNSKVTDAIRTAPKGTTFTGTIEYHNLHEDELGLLLWCLRLEEGCFQQLGKAKPYGYGRVTLKITSLQEYNSNELYQALAYKKPEPDENMMTERINKLIDAYDKTVCQLAELKSTGKGEKKKPASIHNVSSVINFLYLKRTIRDNESVTYMQKKKHRNVGPVMDTLDSIRKEEIKDQKTKQAKPQSSNPFAALEGIFD